MLHNDMTKARGSSELQSSAPCSHCRFALLSHAQVTFALCFQVAPSLDFETEPIPPTPITKNNRLGGFATHFASFTKHDYVVLRKQRSLGYVLTRLHAARQHLANKQWPRH